LTIYSYVASTSLSFRCASLPLSTIHGLLFEFSIALHLYPLVVNLIESASLRLAPQNIFRFSVAIPQALFQSRLNKLRFL